MFIKPKTVIKGYFFLFTFIYVGYLSSVLNPASFLYSFYYILISFNPAYKINYYSCVLSAIFDVLALIPIYLFIYNKQFLTSRIWQRCFTLRIIFDLTGHLYEYYTLRSLFFYDDIILGVSASLLTFILVLPSYVIGYQYA